MSARKVIYAVRKSGEYAIAEDLPYLAQAMEIGKQFLVNAGCTNTSFTAWEKLNTGDELVGWFGEGNDIVEIWEYDDWGYLLQEYDQHKGCDHG